MNFRMGAGRRQELRAADLEPRMLPDLKPWHLMALSCWVRWLGRTVLGRCLELGRGRGWRGRLLLPRSPPVPNFTAGLG